MDFRYALEPTAHHSSNQQRGVTMPTCQAHQPRRHAPRKAFALAILCALLPRGPALAEERAHRLQGLFCNTEAQIDETLEHLRHNVGPRMAAALTNDGRVVCTYVDLLHYVVDRPLVLGEIPGALPLVKYEARLIGVEVGGNVRAVSPPVRIFFVSPERLAGAPVERRA